MQEMQETWVQSQRWENPLEKEVAAHSSILAWETPRTEEPGGLQSMKESDTTQQLDNNNKKGQEFVLSPESPGEPVGDFKQGI